MRASGALDTLAHPAADSVVAAPREDWAVADYAMDEFLVPLLRTFDRDTSTHTIAIYRPTPLRWDTVHARVIAVGVGPRAPFVALLRDEQTESLVVLLVSADDVVLYSEDTREIGSRRVLRGDSHRNAEFQALVRAAGLTPRPTSGQPHT